MVIVRVTHSWDSSVSVFEFDNMEYANAWVENFYSDCEITRTGNVIEVYF